MNDPPLVAAPLAPTSYISNISSSVHSITTGVGRQNLSIFDQFIIEAESRLASQADWATTTNDTDKLWPYFLQLDYRETRSRLESNLYEGETIENDILQFKGQYTRDDIVGWFMVDKKNQQKRWQLFVQQEKQREAVARKHEATVRAQREAEEKSRKLAEAKKAELDRRWAVLKQPPLPSSSWPNLDRAMAVFMERSELASKEAEERSRREYEQMKAAILALRMSNSVIENKVAAVTENLTKTQSKVERIEAQFEAVQGILQVSEQKAPASEQHTVEHQEQQCSTDQRNSERERDESESEISELTCEFSDNEEEQSTKFQAEFDERANSAVERECETTVTQDAIQPRTVIDLQLDISDIASSFLSNAAAEQEESKAAPVADSFNVASFTVSCESVLFPTVPLIEFSDTIRCYHSFDLLESFTLFSSFSQAFPETQQSSTAIQSHLAGAIFAVLLRAKVFTVVSSSTMWDPGGSSPFRRNARRDDADRANAGGKRQQRCLASTANNRRG